MKYTKKSKYIVYFLFINNVLHGDGYLFSVYNDFFVGTDKHFTNGILLAWLENPKDKDSYTKFVIDNLSFLNIKEDKNYNAGLSFSQAIITPEDTSISYRQYDDIPYVGYLALSGYIFEWDDKSFSEYSVEIGVIGKEAGAKFVQTNVHKMIGSSKPKGWDTQLPTRYLINFLWNEGKKTSSFKISNTLEFDWFNHYGVSVGLGDVSAFLGSVIRIGNNYVYNFNAHYPYLKDESTLLMYPNKHKSFGWSMNCGINGELLGYSYILDKAKELGYNTQKNIYNLSLYFGFDFYFKNQKLSFFYQSPSHYIKNQNQFNIFGGFIYAYNFN